MQTNRAKRCFTLLEVMIGLIVLLCAASVIGLRTHASIERKRFSSDIERIQSHLRTLRQLAINTQTDICAVLEQEKGKWTFTMRSADPARKTCLPALSLHSFTLLVEGREKNRFTVQFFSSGEVMPIARLSFQYKDLAKQISLQHLLQIEEGDGAKALGPLHPEEV